MTGKTIAGTLAAALVANAVFYLWGRHSFMPLGLIWVSAVLLGVLLFVLAAILKAFNRARPDPAARLTIRMSVLSALVCFATLPTVPLLQARHRADYEEALSRAESLRIKLREYQLEHGEFPATLDAVSGEEPLPWLLREPYAYRSSGTSFVIQVRQPGHPFAARELRP